MQIPGPECSATKRGMAMPAGGSVGPSVQCLPRNPRRLQKSCVGPWREEPSSVTRAPGSFQEPCPRHDRAGPDAEGRRGRRPASHLPLGLLQQAAEPLVAQHPVREVGLASELRVLQPLPQLAEGADLLVQLPLPRSRGLEIQLQVQGRAGHKLGQGGPAGLRGRGRGASAVSTRTAWAGVGVGVGSLGPRGFSHVDLGKVRPGGRTGGRCFSMRGSEINHRCGRGSLKAPG